MRYLKSFGVFESNDYNYLKDVDALDKFIRTEAGKHLPEGIIVKIRKKICNISGFVRELTIKFRKPNSEQFAKCEPIEFNEILPAVENLNKVLKDFGMCKASRSSSYLTYSDNEYLQLKNTRANIYSLEFKLKTLDTKKVDPSEFLIDEIFLCCIDRNIRVNTGVINGYLSLRAYLNYNGSNVRSIHDPNFVIYDDNFYLDFSDSIHKFEKIYNLKLSSIFIEGQKKDEFSGSKRFNTLEEFEEYPKEELKLTIIRVSFEL